MVSRIKTFVLSGVKTLDVNVEVKISSGIVAFNIVMKQKKGLEVL